MIQHVSRVSSNTSYIIYPIAF